MLTIFSTAKAFTGLSGVIQRNAIRSWTLLRPECEIILVGDDEGTREITEEFRLIHIPDIPNTKFGAPRVDSMFKEAERVAQHRLLCHVNADIILMSDFMRAVEQVSNNMDLFMMSGLRWNIGLTEELEFGPGWEDQLRAQVEATGKIHFRTGVDYFVYPSGLITKIPPFGIGRTWYDAWLLYRARAQGAALVDATEVVMAVHPNHDYSHHPDGARGIFSGVEYEHNRELAAGRSQMLIIKDRTHVLKPRGLRRSLDGWRLWRLLRTALVLYPSLPLPLRLGVQSINGSIDAAVKLCLRLGFTKPHMGPKNV